MRNATKTAKSLGISRPTFYKYEKEGLPLDIGLAKQWVLERRARDGRGGKRVRLPSKIFELKEAILMENLAKAKAETELKQMELAIARKRLSNLMSVDDQQEQFQTLGQVKAALRRKTIDIGTPFGDLEVIGVGPMRKNRSTSNCKCVCGKVKEISNNCLLNGETTSCGCYRKLRAAQTVNTPEWKANNKAANQMVAYSKKNNV